MQMKKDSVRSVLILEIYFLVTQVIQTSTKIKLTLSDCFFFSNIVPHPKKKPHLSRNKTNNIRSIIL